jgi:hypothetical protein
MNNLNFEFLLYSHTNKSIPSEQMIVKEYYSDNCKTKGKNHEFFIVSKKGNKFNFNNNINSLDLNIKYKQCRNCFVIKFVEQR